MNKKLLAILATVPLALAMTACGSSPESTTEIEETEEPAAVEQSAPSKEPAPSEEPAAAEEPEPEMTVGERNALRSAENYLDFMGFSRDGLIEQLEFEGFSTEDATYAVDHITVDWNEQAARSAENFLSVSSFSRDGLIEQLKYEGFSTEQAEYGAAAVGY